MVVVQDHVDQRILFARNGFTFVAASRDGRLLRLPEGEWDLVERIWTKGPILSFAWPSAGAAVLLFFDPDWTPRNWYVNLEAPLRPTGLGFDTEERILDIVVAPDLSAWEWKDEDELEDAVRRGLFTPDEAISLREEGERVRRRLVDREAPFDRDWSSWRPDPAWPVPTLPAGWDGL
jgi:Protein of unknown function (DUF402)